MNEQRSKSVAAAVVVVMTLGSKDHLDAAGREALEDALDRLAEYSGRTVANAFVTWQRTGCLRRDPRPAPMREVGGTAPLRKHEPFLGGL
ncbi:MAG: hypothetical protein KA387_06970 [Rubrivivax sp.]|nr:hypothetical protein [Rubrivivax sp.]